MDYIILYRLGNGKDLNWLTIKDTEPYNGGHRSEDDAIDRAL